MFDTAQWWLVMVVTCDTWQWPAGQRWLMVVNGWSMIRVQVTTVDACSATCGQGATMKWWLPGLMVSATDDSPMGFSSLTRVPSIALELAWTERCSQPTTTIAWKSQHEDFIPKIAWKLPGASQEVALNQQPYAAIWFHNDVATRANEQQHRFYFLGNNDRMDSPEI